MRAWATLLALALLASRQSDGGSGRPTWASANDAARPAHTATFVCDIAGLNSSVLVDMHWISGGRRKLKHTFTSQRERWTTRTAPGHQFAAFIRSTAAIDEGQTSREQLLARYTIGSESGDIHVLEGPAATVAATNSLPAASPSASMDLTPAETTAVAAAAAEAQRAAAAPLRPAHLLPTADFPIARIQSQRGGVGPRYVPGDELKWRPDNERAMLVAKQPRLVRALTAQGFEKRPIPKKLFGMLRFFYDTEAARGGAKPEWEKGGPRLIVDPQDSGRVPTTVVALSTKLRDAIVVGIRTEIATWAGLPPEHLEKSAVYGIREYHRGVVLKRHVDRVQSHVLSAILNIAQQGMDSQWCLTIQDHQGEEHEAVLTPGEMLLYESAALVHGRPYPLDGELYANAFVHFRPATGWDYSPGDIIEDYLPAKVKFVNRVPLQTTTSWNSAVTLDTFTAVGLFWCRGMRNDVLQGVNRRHLHSFTPHDAESRYITRTDPGHTFEAYGFSRGEPTHWQEGTLLGRYVAAQGDSVVEVRVPNETDRLLHPYNAATRESSETMGVTPKMEL